LCSSGEKYKKCCLLLQEKIAHRPPPAGELKYWATTLAHSFLWEKARPFSDLIELVQAQPSPWIVPFLCRMNLLLWKTEGSKKRVLDREFANSLLKGANQIKANMVLSGMDKMVFVSELPLLLLLRTAILKCGEHEDKKPGNLHQLGEAFLIGNEYTEPPQPRHSVETTLSLILRNMYFHWNDDIRAALTRMYALIDEIPLRLASEPGAVNFSQEFQSAYGISFKRYMAFMFGLWVHWFNGPSTFQEQQPADLKELFSKSSATPEEVKTLLSRCVLDLPQYVKTLEAEVKDLSLSQYDCLTFFNHPLISSEQRWCWPVSMRFLGNKLGHTLYWDLHDALRAQGDRERMAFTNFFGKVFETYVLDLLRQIFPFGEAQVRLRGKKAGEGPEIDYLIVEEDAAILIEIKTSRLNLKTVQTGDIASFDSDLQKTVLDPAEQLTNAGISLQEGKMDMKADLSKVRHWYPVILSFAPFPQHKVVWDRIQSKLDERGFLSRERFEPLNILNISELELYHEFFVRKGLVELLAVKNSDSVNRANSIKNFIADAYPEEEFPFAAIMRVRFDNVVEKLIAEMLPKEASRASSYSPKVQ
jgi:hypothetical protein